MTMTHGCFLHCTHFVQPTCILVVAGIINPTAHLLQYFKHASKGGNDVSFATFPSYNWALSARLKTNCSKIRNKGS